jgi:cell division septation protein DedD
MPALHRDRDTSDQRQDYRDQKDDDREISLGTGTILAIFFALALVCAAFFGLGYSMGRKSAQPPAIAAASSESTAPISNFSGFKPPAGSPAAQPAAKKPADTAPPADPDGEIVTTPVPPSQDSGLPSKSSARKESGPAAMPAPIVRDAPRTAQAASPGAPQNQTQPSAMPAIAPNGTAIVQVAAVSHQEDADTLIAALKKRGYTVFIRQEPLDKLLHVQLGPFATRKDAEAMRQRLLADGYNAIVK